MAQYSTGEKPWACRFLNCQFRTGHRGSLTRHQQTKHQNEALPSSEERSAGLPSPTPRVHKVGLRRSRARATTSFTQLSQAATPNLITLPLYRALPYFSQSDLGVSDIDQTFMLPTSPSSSLLNDPMSDASYASPKPAILTYIDGLRVGQPSLLDQHDSMTMYPSHSRESYDPSCEFAQLSRNELPYFFSQKGHYLSYIPTVEDGIRYWEMTFFDEQQEEYIDQQCLPLDPQPSEYSTYALI